MIYVCQICGYEYDEAKEEKKFSELPESWTCPVCGAPKSLFEPKKSSEKGESSNQSESSTKATKEPEQSEQKMRTSSDAIADGLSAWGVKLTLGMVGHSNLGMASAIRHKVEEGKMRYVGIRHEGTAAFAASAYGKLTGRPAACLTIAGPGATNLMTGLYDAKLDSSPVIALTGQIPTTEAWTFRFQEIDLTSAFADVSVNQQTLTPKSNFAQIGATACKNSILKRGVSHIILPDDLQTLPLEGTTEFEYPSSDVLDARIAPAPREIDCALEAIEKSSRPIIIAGEGARDANKELLDFANALRIPIMTTYRAKGILPDSSPLACGVIGLSGTPISAKFMKQCDLIIAFGVGFSKHSKIDTKKRTVRIDRDKFNMTHIVNPEVSVYSDCKSALSLFMSKLSNRKFGFDFTAEIAAEKASWNEEKARRAGINSDGKISPAAAICALSDSTPDDAIVSVDVGNVAYELGRYFEAKKQRFLLSWYLGSIGVGLPSAIGAWCATQEQDSPVYGKRVVAFIGDGGFGQYLAEWTTVVKSGANIVCVVLNNSELAKISLEQRAAKTAVWETRLINPNFANYAENCGALGIRVSHASRLKDAFERAFAHKGAVLVEILSDPDQV